MAVLQLLRSHVVQRPHELADRRQFIDGSLLAAEQCEAEVEDFESGNWRGGERGRGQLRLPISRSPHPPIKHQIRRLDVTMHDSKLVRVFQTNGRLPCDLAGIGDRQRTAGFRDRVEVAALDVFHDEEVRAIDFARVGRLHDRGMTELADDSHLTLKPRDRLFVAQPARRQQLHGDQPIEPRVDRFVNRPHAAGTERFEQPIIAQHWRTLGDDFGSLAVRGWLERLHFVQRLLQFGFDRGIGGDGRQSQSIGQRVGRSVELRDRRLAVQTRLQMHGDGVALLVGQLAEQIVLERTRIETGRVRHEITWEVKRDVLHRITTELRDTTFFPGVLRLDAAFHSRCVRRQ